MAVAAAPGMNTTNISVQQLASDYATRQLQDRQELEPEERQLLHNRITYDAKITAFNASTIATIVTLGITLITNSVLWLVIFSGCYLVRKSIENAIHITGTDRMHRGDRNIPPEILIAIQGIYPEDMQRGLVTEELQIEDENWQLNQYKLLDFVVWKNWTPREDLAQRPQGVERHQMEQEQDIDGQEQF